jgi:hypothetical protein
MKSGCKLMACSHRLAIAQFSVLRTLFDPDAREKKLPLMGIM